MPTKTQNDLSIDNRKLVAAKLATFETLIMFSLEKAEASAILQKLEQTHRGDPVWQRVVEDLREALVGADHLRSTFRYSSHQGA